MSDETREQINRDAYKYAPQNADYFKQGATHQHAIGVKDGYNQALNDVVALILTGTLEGGRQLLYQPGWKIKEELEKLRQ